MCFTMAFLQQLFIWAIVIFAVVAILRVLIPYVLSLIGATLGAGGNVVIQILKIFLYAVIAIIVVIFAFEVIACLIGYTGGLPRLR